MSTIENRLRVSVAEYEYHRERTAKAGSDPDAGWWYAAWAEALIPVLKELLHDLKAGH